MKRFKIKDQRLYTSQIEIMAHLDIYHHFGQIVAIASEITIFTMILGSGDHS